MRVAQYRILNEILEHIELPDYIYAFERDKSIPIMADHHLGKRCLISVDIKDFFNSITQRDLYSLLTLMGISEIPAKTLSELMTFKAYVPQGALTSPKISNLISAASFGPIIKEFCDAKGYALTIYADDITISSDGMMDTKEAITAVIDAIRGCGFRVNHKKTKVMSKKRRQYVCGVVVNTKKNLPVQERYLLRAQIHRIEKLGIQAAAESNGFEAGEFIYHLKGRLSWFKQLNPEIASKYLERLERVAPTETVSA